MITIPMIVAVIGLILYLVTLTPKVNEAGRIMFFCGLLAMMLAFQRTALL